MPAGLGRRAAGPISGARRPMARIRWSWRVYSGGRASTHECGHVSAARCQTTFFVVYFYRQAEEEREHAMKFVRFIADAAGQLEIPGIQAPQATFKSAEEAVRKSVDWEVTVTKQINALMDLAIKDNDHITRNFLNWFMEEQLEEVSSMETLLSMPRRAGESGLLFVENHLAQERKGGAPEAGGHS